MSEETHDVKREFQEEAEDLIRLGNLLRVSRSEADQLAIEKIIRSDLNIQEKIRRIEEIDQNRDKSPEEKITPKEKEPVRSKRKYPVKETIFLREKETPPRELHKSPAKKLANVKATYSTVPYFSFLFREYRRIREFGMRTQILEPVLFPPSVRLNRDIGQAFTKQLHPLASQFLEILNPVLESGWLHLTKGEYNLLAVMKKLCVEIKITNFHKLNHKDKNLINRLRTLENLFLILHYLPENQLRISSALEKVLSRKKKFKEIPPGISKMLRKILDRESMRPSLYNFILGLNMRKCNRYFTMDQLISRSVNGKIIDSGDFNCEPRVYEKIQAYVKKSEKMLQELQKKKKEIQKQKIFLPVDEGNEVDLTQLQRFYELFQKRNKFNFSKDKENIVIFVPRFLQMFVGSFEPILNDKIPISGVGKAEIFADTFFQIEFTRLNYVINKMERVVFSFPYFPRNRYLGIKMSNTGSIAIEAEFIHLVEEALVHLLNIAKKLSNVLGLRKVETTPEENPAPLDLLVLKGKEFSLPYEDGIIESDNAIHNKTVRQALEMAVTLVFLTGVFLNDETSLSLLHIEKHIDQKIKTIMVKMERIADSFTYLKLKESLQFS